MRFNGLARALALAPALALAAFFVSAGVAAQVAEERTVEIEGETLRYTLRTYPAGVHRVGPADRLSPVNALDTLELLNQYLTAGRIEDAALLSNAPKRRYEVFLEYRQEAGEKEFRTVFEQYFDPANRLVAEIGMGEHSLLVWHLAQADRYAGLFFVRVDDRTLMDDIPGETRLKLRRLLEAYRAGSLR